MEPENDVKDETNFACEMSVYPERAIISAIAFVRHNGKLPETFTANDILDVVVGQARKIKGGNTGLIIRHLYSQALALELIFERAMIKASNAHTPQEYEAYTRAAMKAQRQSQLALEGVLNVVNPKESTVIKQQNNAVNQVVSNGPEKNIVANELLSEVKHEALEQRRESETVGVNPVMGALEKVERP
ncbi:MAG: hypothetical protein ACHQAX_09655 [Gammaproteobacteria bacterium]